LFFYSSRKRNIFIFLSHDFGGMAVCANESELAFSNSDLKIYIFHGNVSDGLALFENASKLVQTTPDVSL
jgi:hypothetical protein